MEHFVYNAKILFLVFRVFPGDFYFLITIYHLSWSFSFPLIEIFGRKLEWEKLQVNNIHTRPVLYRVVLLSCSLTLNTLCQYFYD